MKCVSKEQFDCIYLTKKNLNEFLRIVEPCIKYAFIQNDNDKYCLIKYPEREKYYFYNYWYVINYNGRTWEIYTDKEFKAMFKIVEER